MNRAGEDRIALWSAFAVDISALLLQFACSLNALCLLIGGNGTSASTLSTGLVSLGGGEGSGPGFVSCEGSLVAWPETVVLFVFLVRGARLRFSSGSL